MGVCIKLTSANLNLQAPLTMACRKMAFIVAEDQSRTRKRICALQEDDVIINLSTYALIL